MTITIPAAVIDGAMASALEAILEVSYSTRSEGIWIFPHDEEAPPLDNRLKRASRIWRVIAFHLLLHLDKVTYDCHSRSW